MSTRIEEIYAFVLPEMAANDIPDTTQHRAWFLEGLYDSWKEDTTLSLDKTLYMMAVQSEIMSLSLQLMLPKEATS